MALRHESESRLHLKTRCKKIDHLMAEKVTNNKSSQMGQATPKKIFLNKKIRTRFLL